MTGWDDTPTTLPHPEAQPVRREVRLRLRNRPATHGLDGAWWPRSGDPEAAFPELVLVMSSWVGPVSRVTYHVADWAAPGGAMTIDGWPVELVGSPMLQRHTVVVTGTGSRERTLLVVPPDAPGTAARAVLVAMADPEVVGSAEDMLTRNGVPPTAPVEGAH